MNASDEKLPTMPVLAYGFYGPPMDSSNAFMHPVDDGLIAAVPQAPEDSRPAALLRGTARGLEIVVHGTATVDAIALAILARLDEAPGFFRGSDVRVRVEDGPLPAGCLARLDGSRAGSS